MENNEGKNEQLKDEEITLKQQCEIDHANEIGTCDDDGKFTPAIATQE